MNKSNVVAAAVLAVAALLAATPFIGSFGTPAVFTDGDQAKVVIKAPEKVKVGQLVTLDVSGSTASTFSWQVIPPTENFRVIEGGKEAVFSSQVGGDYLFVVAVGKDDTVDVQVHKVTVTGGQPQPTDDFATKVAAWCEKVESPTKRDDALKLAQSFSSVSAIISDTMTPADIVEATKKSNRDALGSNLDHWVPFLESLQAELKAQNDAGKLQDTAAHAAMWRAIADGLKAYADTL